MTKVAKAKILSDASTPSSREVNCSSVFSFCIKCFVVTSTTQTTVILKELAKYQILDQSIQTVHAVAPDTVPSVSHFTHVSNPCPLASFSSMTRVYWSTVDARRRCVYTCRIIEVRPQVVEVEVPTKDMTVPHDPCHPCYDAELDHKWKNPRVSPSRQAPGTARPAENNEGQSEGDGGGLVRFTVSAEMPCTGFLEPSSSHPHDETAGVESEKLPVAPGGRLHNRSASLDDATAAGSSHEPELSSSWPGAHKQGSPLRRQSVDLSMLSEKTRKLLGSANLARCVENSVENSVLNRSDLQLTEVVERLNQAAAKNRDRSRSRSREPSIERAAVKESRDGELVFQQYPPYLGFTSEKSNQY